MKIKDLKYFEISFDQTQEQLFLIQKNKAISECSFLQFYDELDFCKTFILTMNEKIRNYESIQTQSFMWWQISHRATQ